MLHLYIERKPEERRDAPAIAAATHEAIKEVDPEYDDWVKLLAGKRPEVTLLSEGTFQRYTAEKLAAGVELAQLKPARMKPSEEILQQLLRQSEEKDTPS